MNLKRSILIVIGLALPWAAHAHRSWLYPSATVLSGNSPWITVDAAVSDELFYFDHQPLQIGSLSIVGPDGAAVNAENIAAGKFRNTFDVQLQKPGTYKLSVLNQGFTASYKLSGEPKRWRGTLEAMAKEIPAEAEGVAVVQTMGRVETFVTTGKPNAAAFKPSGVGLDLVPITHPNDLFAGDKASFRLLLDGKPATGVKVAVVPGGIRYRSKLNEIGVLTDAEGVFHVPLAQPGMYWINASVEDKLSTYEGATRRANYSVTVEVLSH